MRPSTRARLEPRHPSRPPPGSHKLLIGVLGGAALALAIVVVVLLKNRGDDASRAKPPSIPSAAAPTGATPPKPEPAARTAATLRAELDAAANAAVALALAKEARTLADEPLADAAERRAFELDPKNPAALAAAEVRPLDPDRDFRRLSDVIGWSQSYLARQWIGRREPASTRWRRAELAQEWDALFARIEARHQKAESDAFLRRIDALSTQVTSLPVFDSMRWKVIESLRPFALFVEMKGANEASDASEVREIERNLGPYLDALRARLDETLLRWFGQARKTDDVLVIWVLRSFDRYEQIVARIDQDDVVPGQLAHYDVTKRYALACLPEVGGVYLQETMQILLHELVHAQIDACVRDSGGQRFRVAWVEEGLAEYLSAFKRRDREHVFWDPGLQPRVDEFLKELQPYPELEDRIVLPKLLEVDHMGTLMQQVAELLERRRIRATDAARARFLSAFYVDSFLLVRWLLEADGRAHEAAFVAYLKELAAGAKPAAAASKHLAFLSKDPAAVRRSVADFTSDDRARRRDEESASVPRAGPAPSSAPVPATIPAPGAAGATCVSAIDLSAAEPAVARALRWLRFLEGGGRAAATHFADPTSVEARVAAAFEKSLAALLSKWKSSSPKLRLESVDGSFVAAGDEGVSLKTSEGEARVAWRDVPPDQWAFFFLRDLAGDADALAAAAWMRELAGKHSDALAAAKRLKGDLAADVARELERVGGIAAAYESAARLDSLLHVKNDATFAGALPAIWKQHGATPVGAAVKPLLRARFVAVRARDLPDAELLAKASAVAAKVANAPAGALGLEATLRFAGSGNDGMSGAASVRLLADTLLPDLMGFGEKVAAFGRVGERLVPSGESLVVSELALAGDLDLELACDVVATGPARVGFVVGSWEEEPTRFFAWSPAGVTSYEGRVRGIETRCSPPLPEAQDAKSWTVAIRRRGEKLEFVRDGKPVLQQESRHPQPARLFLAYRGDAYVGITSIRLRGALPAARRAELAASLAESEAAALLE